MEVLLTADYADGRGSETVSGSRVSSERGHSMVSMLRVESGHSMMTPDHAAGFGLPSVEYFLRAIRV